VKGILQILSTDNVAPLAVIQMENLGAAFPLSGRLIAELPDHLQRATSYRLEALGLMIGWQKGDTASILAASSGGQYISLVASCLYNVCRGEIGYILKQLSGRLLPKTANLASPSQLQKVSELVADKLALLGFGNIIAYQACRIHRTFAQLGKDMPSDLLHTFAPESVIDLFHAFSRSVREDGLNAIVKGTTSMGYIVALAVTLFPDDTFITVEGLIIHEGARRTICIELESSGETPVTITLAQVLGSTSEMIALIHRNTPLATTLQYNWKGWLGDMTKIKLLENGYGCSSELLKALGHLTLYLPHRLKITTAIDKQDEKDSESRMKAMKEFITDWDSEIRESLDAMLGLSLGDDPPLLDLREHFETFHYTIQFEKLVKSCIPDNTKPLNDTKEDIWCILIQMALVGLPALFIRPHKNASWQPPTSSWGFMLNDFRAGIYENYLRPRPQALVRYVDEQLVVSAAALVDAIYHHRNHEILATSSSSTMIPHSLLQLQDDPLHCPLFELFDGRLIFNDRPQGAMVCGCSLGGARNRQRYGDKALEERHSDLLSPTSDGVPSKVSFKITEGDNNVLFLHCSATDAGQVHRLCLREPINAQFAVRHTKPCPHPYTKLAETYPSCVRITSAVNPDARPGNLAIVQTVGSPTAQFLALSGNGRAILCQDSCIDCALDQVISRHWLWGTTLFYNKMIMR
jgi:hypothetical protein